MRSPRAAATLALLLLPLVWLWPCTFGDRYFVPYDVNQFAPVANAATDAELAAAREGANLDVTEVPVWFLPELELARDELRAGRLPTWNPHARAGAPLHAHGLIGLCYPPNLVALFSEDPAARLGLVAWINLALGGLLAFGLLRQLGLGVAGAFVGAAMFELSGPMAANSFFWMRLASYVWLPGVLWAMARVADDDETRPLPIVALAACFAMTWLGGFPPFAATTTVFAGMWYAWLVAAGAARGGGRVAARHAARLLAGLGLGAVMSLPQVLPSLQFFAESARPPTPAWRDVANQAFEPYGLLTWLAPDAFGHPAAADRIPYANGAAQILLNTRAADGKTAIPNYNYTEYSLTVSSLGLLLAAYGLARGRGQHAWFARVALGTALGLGLFLPGFQALFHLPVVQNVWPMRWPAAGTLFVAWLLALGFERLRAAPRHHPLWLSAAALALGGALWWTTATPLAQHLDDPTWAVKAMAAAYDTTPEGVLNHIQGVPPAAGDRFAASFARFAAAGAEGAAWLLGASVAMFALGMLRGRRRDLVLSVAVAAALVQLGVDGASVNHGTSTPRSRDTAAHAFLRDQAASRAEDGGFTIVRATSAPAVPSQLPPGQLMVPGLRDLNFYSHADKRTLQPLLRLLERYAPDLGLPADVGARVAGKGFLSTTVPAGLLRHPWFDLLGVRYVLSDEPTLAAVGLGKPVGPEFPGRGGFFVYERPSALPRAFVVPRVVKLADDDAVVAALTAEDLNPAAQAYVSNDALEEPTPPAAADAPRRAVRFVRDDPTHIELEVDAGAARALVLADTFLPGWRATVDGAPAAVLRCNHSQRLVLLPESACRVVWRYEAPGLSVGAWLQWAAVLAALCAVVARGRRPSPA
ncbi:MAG: hypothetical protein VXY92_13100 [Planctomycetota bacterium]|nr:hypothetical protein [Planctomycetota bacterium]